MTSLEFQESALRSWGVSLLASSSHSRHRNSLSSRQRWTATRNGSSASPIRAQISGRCDVQSRVPRPPLNRHARAPSSIAFGRLTSRPSAVLRPIARALRRGLGTSLRVSPNCSRCRVVRGERSRGLQRFPAIGSTTSPSVASTTWVSKISQRSCGLLVSPRHGGSSAMTLAVPPPSRRLRWLTVSDQHTNLHPMRPRKGREGARASSELAPATTRERIR